ncbi:hypothetical protein GCM10023340_38950 [Nocardioides marinquilinus]|uniref:Phage tail protein n=1 Tax=Nocardioides marinquilinus TaxID=1210400 RepID=A0ABP9PZN0_9ACTN
MATRQEFTTTDVLRLRALQPWPGMPNLITNPSGAGGRSGWGLNSGYQITVVPQGFRLLRGGATPATYGPIKLAPGVDTRVRAQIRRTGSSTAGAALKFTLRFRRTNGTSVTSADSSTTTAANGVATLAVDAPADAVSVSIAVATAGVTLGQALVIRDLVLIAGAAGEVNASTLTAERTVVDVLAPSHDLTIERDELQLSTLSGTVLAASLDPAANTTLRKGTPIDAQVLVAGAWESIFRGTVQTARTTYDLLARNVADEKRTRIAFTAVDNLTTLATTSRPDGVATIAQLPAVLAGTGVPWNCNGSTDALDPDVPVTYVSKVEQATAVDQVAITRDSVLGYAWVDRKGVLQAWDRDLISNAVVDVLSEDVYASNGIDLDFDPARLINAVTIKRLTVGTDGNTEEVPYGPYNDLASQRRWNDIRPAEFTVHGLSDAQIADYAAEILAANSTPGVKVNSITLTLATTAQLGAHVLRDLYDLVTIVNTRAGIDEDARVVSVTHRITPTKWQLVLGFAADGSVAPPQVTPSPTPRPPSTEGIGDVKPFYGTIAQAEANNPGWIVMNGAAYDTTRFPKLLAHLQTLVAAGLHTDATIRPNMTDRFPIGAGIKAVGSAGGSVNTGPPSTTSRMTTASGTPDNVGGAGHTHDAVPPWRALYFLIRAA